MSKNLTRKNIGEVWECVAFRELSQEYLQIQTYNGDLVKIVDCCPDNGMIEYRNLSDRLIFVEGDYFFQRAFRKVKPPLSGEIWHSIVLIASKHPTAPRTPKTKWQTPIPVQITGYNSITKTVTYFYLDKPGQVSEETFEEFATNFQRKESKMKLVIDGCTDTDQVDVLLSERGKTHGNFADNARISQQIKTIVRREAEGKLLTQVQLEALDYFAGKISRILSGNANEPDHWDDIAGYAKLVSNSLKGENR